jgi:hypothetical protein
MRRFRTRFVLSLAVGLLNAAYVTQAVQVTGLPVLNPMSGSKISAGDFNGDTILDFVVGSPPGFTDYAAVIILGGSVARELSATDFSSGPNGVKILSSTLNAQQGTFVGAAGDINNDGLDDILVGALSSESKRGAVYVVFGFVGPYKDLYLKDISNSKIGFVITGAVVTNRLNSPPACLHGAIGDVSGDDNEDITIGDASGAVFIIYGKPSYAPVADIDLDNGFSGSGLGTKLSEMEIVTEACATPVLLRHLPAKTVPAARTALPKTVSERSLSTPVAEPVSQPVPAPAPEPVSQPVSQPVAAPAPEPVSQPVAVPVSKPVPGPVPAPVAQPVPQPVPQPVQPPQSAPQHPTSNPNTAPPSLAVRQPTQRPTQPALQPQPLPVPSPASPPNTPTVASPTASPVASPDTPTMEPSTESSGVPVTTPVSLPVSLPISPPATLPVTAPVPAPTAGPTVAPTRLPPGMTFSPTTALTRAPTNTRAPTTTPAPTVEPTAPALRDYKIAMQVEQARLSAVCVLVNNHLVD